MRIDTIRGEKYIILETVDEFNYGLKDDYIALSENCCHREKCQNHCSVYCDSFKQKS